VPESQAAPVPLDQLGGVQRALVVTAHPDDVDFGAGGTVAAWVGAGVEVVYCVVTDGDAGGSDRSISRRDMAALRRDEQRAAAAALGVTCVTFLGYPDGRLTPSLELRRDVSRIVRKFRPERLLCQSPERNWERIGASHPDHLAAGEAAVCAAYPDARNPFAHPELLEEGLEPHAVREVWLMASPHANRAVDITDFFGLKLEALLSHQSQVSGEADLQGRLKGWASSSARAAGLGEDRMAEMFQVVNMPPGGSS
jgi:LmbE family N-acetylglucosaminyl deacetylase